MRRKQISDYLGYAMMPLHSKMSSHIPDTVVGNLFAAFNQRLPFTYASTYKVYLTQMGLPFRTMVRLRCAWLPDHVGTYEVDCPEWCELFRSLSISNVKAHSINAGHQSVSQGGSRWAAWQRS